MANRVWHELWRGGVAALVSVLLLAAGAAGKSWPHATYYTVVVRPGDTVTKLGARYHVAASRIAELNRVDPLGELRSGQVLQIPATSRATRQAVLSEAVDSRLPNYAAPPKSIAVQRTSLAPLSVPVHELVLEKAEPAGRVGKGIHLPTGGPRFIWPIAGSVISRFGLHGEGERNDGVNISAELGQPIHAAAGGTVTYAGNGLKNYGNLILITHAGGYVTAYAHTDSIAVARGDRVEQGQVIGTAGETGGVDRPQLHFEIRHNIRPVDPGMLLVASR